MNRASMVKSLLCIILLGIVTFACKDNTPIDDKNVVLNGPTNLYVTNIGDSVIRLKWTASTSSNDPTFAGYTIVVRSLAEKSQAVEVRYINLDGNVTTADVDSIKTGTKVVVYTFFVESRKKDGSLSTDGPTVTSAGGLRFATLSNNPIRLYEPADPDPTHARGLGLYDTTKKAGLLLAPDGAATNQVLWDLVLDNDGGGLALVSPRLASSYVDNMQFFHNTTKRPRVTYISDSTWVTENIDNDYHNHSIIPTSERIVPIPSTGVGLLFYVKTFEPRINDTTHVIENHYAKVFVKPDASGNLIQGTAPSRYVELIYSYQLIKETPYAKQ